MSRKRINATQKNEPSESREERRRRLKSNQEAWEASKKYVIPLVVAIFVSIVAVLFYLYGFGMPLSSASSWKYPRSKWAPIKFSLPNDYEFFVKLKGSTCANVFWEMQSRNQAEDLIVYPLNLDAWKSTFGTLMLEKVNFGLVSITNSNASGTIASNKKDGSIRPSEMNFRGSSLKIFPPPYFTNFVVISLEMRLHSGFEVLSPKATVKPEKSMSRQFTLNVRPWKSCVTR